LRYLYLDNGKQSKKNMSYEKDKLNFLILGEYRLKQTSDMLKLVADLDQKNLTKINIILKPHPACPIDVKDYPSIDIEISTEDISEIFSNIDVTFSSNISTAGVDAYCNGIKTLVMKDPRDFNMSLLKEADNVTWIQSTEDIANLIDNFKPKEDFLGKKEDYFYLNQELLEWKKIIEQSV